MLRISKLTDYATVILTHIAHKPLEVHAATDITKVTKISLPTVSKVLKLLVKAKLLESKRGAKGGYVLLGNIKEINVAQIIVAIEGPISMTECATDLGQCEQEESCEIKGNWGLINRAVYAALEEVRLADLLGSAETHSIKVRLPTRVAKKTSESNNVES